MNTIGILAASQSPAAQSGADGSAAVATGLLLLLGNFLLTWLVSMLVAGDRGNLRNTVYYHLLHLAGGAALTFICLLGDWVHLPVLIAALVLVFLIPMRVYTIGFWRATGFLALMAILPIAAALVIGLGSLFQFLKLEGYSVAIVPSDKAINKELSIILNEATQADLARRVALLHTDLQRERTTLDITDKGAVVEFNQRVAEYNNLNAKLATVQR